MLILGLGGAIITITTKNLSVSLTGISLSALVGILLNLILKEEDSKKKEEE